MQRSTLAPPPPPPGPRPDATSSTLPPPPTRLPRPGPSRRIPRWFTVLFALAVAGGGLAIDREGLGAVIALFVIVVPFEKLFPRHRQPIRRKLWRTDIAYGLAQPLLIVPGIVVAVIVGLLSFAWLPGLAIRPLVGMLPEWGRYAAGFLLFDATFYWAHRWSHEVPFLWRFHSIHHSTEHLDWVSGLRAHPLDGAILAPPIIFLIAAGFEAEYAGVLAVIQIVTGLFLHANVRWRWKWFHRLVITPEFHHWHHTNEPEAISTNHSAFLPLWDTLFGTYHMPEDRRPSVYGVDEAVPETMLGQLRYPFRGLPSPLWVLRHPVLTHRRLRHALRRGYHQVRNSTLRPTHRRDAVA